MASISAEGLAAWTDEELLRHTNGIAAHQGLPEEWRDTFTGSSRWQPPASKRPSNIHSGGGLARATASDLPSGLSQVDASAIPTQQCAEASSNCRIRSEGIDHVHPSSRPQRTDSTEASSNKWSSFARSHYTKQYREYNEDDCSHRRMINAQKGINFSLKRNAQGLVGIKFARTRPHEDKGALIIVGMQVSASTCVNTDHVDCRMMPLVRRLGLVSQRTTQVVW